MKKFLGSILVLCLALVLLVPVAVPVSAAGEPWDFPGSDYQHEPMWGGNGFQLQVGTINIWHDANWLYVNFNPFGGWVMTESHLHVALSLAAIPQTNKGNPIPGQFDYQTIHDPASGYFTYQIPWTTELANALVGATCEQNGDPESGGIYIATHAVVQLKDGSGNILQEETSWADCHSFPGKNWAKCIHYIGY